jgi:type IV secretory pathway VirB2 component (pilin)
MMNKVHVEIAGLAAVILVVLAVDPAAAGIETTLKSITDLLKGNVFRSCAVIAVLIACYRLLFKELELTKFLTIVAAIGIATGAEELVSSTMGG